MLILRYLAGLMVWITIAVVDLALIGCTLYAYNMAGMLTKAGQWGATIAAQLPTDSDPTGGTAAQQGMPGRGRSSGPLMPTLVAENLRWRSACGLLQQCAEVQQRCADSTRQTTLLFLCCEGLSRDNWAYIAYGLTALTVVIWLLTMVMLRRIQVAVACIKVRPAELWPLKRCCGSLPPGSFVQARNPTLESPSLCSEPANNRCSQSALPVTAFPVCRWPARPCLPCPPFCCGPCCRLCWKLAWSSTGWPSQLCCTARASRRPTGGSPRQSLSRWASSS